MSRDDGRDRFEATVEDAEQYTVPILAELFGGRFYPCEGSPARVPRALDRIAGWDWVGVNGVVDAFALRHQDVEKFDYETWTVRRHELDRYQRAQEREPLPVGPTWFCQGYISYSTETLIRMAVTPYDEVLRRAMNPSLSRAPAKFTGTDNPFRFVEWRALEITECPLAIWENGKFTLRRGFAGADGRRPR